MRNVTPAKAGVQKVECQQRITLLDPGIRRDDGKNVLMCR
jgi:hypothetical protein